MIIAFSYYGLSLDENDPDAKKFERSNKDINFRYDNSFYGYC